MYRTRRRGPLVQQLRGGSQPTERGAGPRSNLGGDPAPDSNRGGEEAPFGDQRQGTRGCRGGEEQGRHHRSPAHCGEGAPRGPGEPEASRPERRTCPAGGGGSAARQDSRVAGDCPPGAGGAKPGGGGQTSGRSGEHGFGQPGNRHASPGMGQGQGPGTAPSHPRGDSAPGQRVPEDRRLPTGSGLARSRSGKAE